MAAIKIPDHLLDLAASLAGLPLHELSILQGLLADQGIAAYFGTFPPENPHEAFVVNSSDPLDIQRH